MGFKKFAKKAVGAATGAIKGSILGPAGSVMGAMGGFRGGTQSQNIVGKFGLTSAESRLEREKDIAKGKKFGRDVVPEGSLGRLGTDPDVQAALDVRRQQLSGLTGQETQAMRDVASQQISGATELARRRLAAQQARAGVRGATAGAQQAGIIGQGIQAQQGFERDLLLGQRQAQSQAAGALLGDVSQTRRFDLGQAARERFAELQAGLGMAQLGVTERAGVAAQQANVAAAQAQQPSGGLLGGVLGK